MRLQRSIAFILILIVHLLFTHKYLARVLPQHVWLADVAYLSAYTLLLVWLERKHPGFLGKKWFVPLVLGAVVAVQLFLFYKIPQHSLNVDRWSVISSFWDTALAGKYPYTAKSHMNNMPGPSPFYFLLAFPFYLTGELGFLSLAGLVLFALLCRYYFRYTPITSAVVLLALCSLPVQYEMVTRSTVFFNAVLILGYMLLCLRLQRWTNARIILLGLLGGLLLSTRSVMVLPLIFLYVYLLRNNLGWRHIWLLGASVFVGFVILFIPLYFWDPVLFREYNPITLQKSFMPNSALAVLLLGCVAWSFRTRNWSQVLFGSGVLLFAAVAAYFLYEWHKNAWQDVLFSSIADISYFVMCLPFLFLALFGRE